MANYTLIDTHCHLTNEPLKHDIAGVVARAHNAGVAKLVTISTDIDNIDENQAVADQYPNVYCTIGVHPHESKEALPHNPEHIREVLRAKAVHAKTIAIGETGLDFYYNHSEQDVQIAIFKAHIDVALELDLPIIVHSREAEKATIQLLKDHGQGKLRGVIHCFSGTQKLADEALALGFYISFSGIITFKNATALQQTATTIPLDRILLETDAPYLAPIPHRGKANEPAYVTHTALMVAELRGMPVAELAKANEDNFYALFTRVSR